MPRIHVLHVAGPSGYLSKAAGREDIGHHEPPQEWDGWVLEIHGHSFLILLDDVCACPRLNDNAS
jgi:hypothetical protein